MISSLSAFLFPAYCLSIFSRFVHVTISRSLSLLLCVCILLWLLLNKNPLQMFLCTYIYLSMKTQVVFLPKLKYKYSEIRGRKTLLDIILEYLCYSRHLSRNKTAGWSENSNFYFYEKPSYFSTTLTPTFPHPFLQGSILVFW